MRPRTCMSATGTRPRILAAAILHETNTFNRVPTRLDDFAGRYLCLDAASVTERLSGTATEMGGFLEAADAHGWRLEPVLAAACGPSGPLAAADWADLKRRVLDVPGQFDGVLLDLHGAMVTADSDDPEGDLLVELRRRVGSGTPIVVTMDMHANLGPRAAGAADAIFPYETYPHVDHANCAGRAAAAMARLLDAPRGRGRLTRSVLARPPMLDAADHGRTAPGAPMMALLERARRLREQPGVVNASLTVGFPWADVANAGPAALVTVMRHSEADPRPAAIELAQALWDTHESTRLAFPGPEEAMAAARAGRQRSISGTPMNSWRSGTPMSSGKPGGQSGTPKHRRDFGTPTNQLHSQRMFRDTHRSKLQDTHESTHLTPRGTDEAMTAARAGDGPLLLADFADNPAGGAYGDSPNLLRAMLDAGLENAAFATLADPAAVAVAQAAGEGARVALTVGGRHTPDTTPPLAIEGRVEHLHDGVFRCDGPMLRGTTMNMGPMAVVRVGGVAVVLASRALAVADPALFRAVGIDPTTLDTIALKSRNHHRAAFEPLAREVMLVDAGGIATMRLDTIDYRKLRRPLWPLDPMPDDVIADILELNADERP